MKTSSYHDVVVYIDDVKYILSQNLALELTCCKSAGWRLWKIWGGKSELIGGEFDGTRMCITVSDKVILGKLPEMPRLPDEFGWNGISQHNTIMKTLYLICGPSGSGKTTFANKIKKEKNIANHFEADQWMVDLYGNHFFNPKRLGYCHAKCQKSTEESMQRGEDVIVSNTTLTKKEARPYVELAKKYNYNVEIHHMAGDFKNEHSVPDWKVEEMKKKRQLFSLSDF